MTRKKSNPRIPWPDDKPEREFLVEAHRALARGILGLLRTGELEELGREKIHLLGNYVLLSSLIAPDEPPYHYEQEKQVFVEGIVEAGLAPDEAMGYAQAIYETRIWKTISSFGHIPAGAPEIIETKRGGRVVSRELDARSLCNEAFLVAKRFSD